MPKRFEDMTAEEKLAAFDDYWKKRESRKGTSKARRKVVKLLIDKYPEEYQKYLKAAGGKV